MRMAHGQSSSGFWGEQMALAVELLKGLLGHPVGLLKNLVGGPLVLALLALPVMKFYARPVPLWRLGLTAFGVFFPVVLILFAIYAYWIVSLGVTMRLYETATMVMFCLAGLLITWSLKRQGFSRGFPGIGARTMAGVIILMTILLVVVSVAGIPL
jgi:hypothetical protein